MDVDKYSVISDYNHEVFEFLSEGQNGTIKKVVYYQQIDNHIFNIAFGDWDEMKQRINDKNRSNNNDREKVLATIASTVVDFMKHHPGITLFAKGSTAARTRLYQIGLYNNWHIINQLFVVEGFYRVEWEPFEYGRNYQAFTLKAK